jgi:hypothetical protein
MSQKPGQICFCEKNKIKPKEPFQCKYSKKNSKKGCSIMLKKDVKKPIKEPIKPKEPFKCEYTCKKGCPKGYSIGAYPGQTYGVCCKCVKNPVKIIKPVDDTEDILQEIYQLVSELD